MDIRLNTFPFHLLHQVSSLPNITSSSPSAQGVKTKSADTGQVKKQRKESKDKEKTLLEKIK
jgi:hypothetical protein